MTHETPTKVTIDVATTLELHEEEEDLPPPIVAPSSFSTTLSNCVDSGLDEEAPLCVPMRYLYPPIVITPLIKTSSY